jgi:hypothetical protein
MDNLILNSLDTHKFESHEHFLEVFPLIEEAIQRLGSSTSANTWLLTPVTSEGKRPVDYLYMQQYALFRGFLLRVHSDKEMFRPLTPSNRIHKERSPEEIESAIKRLRPRAWRDDEGAKKLN